MIKIRKEVREALDRMRMVPCQDCVAQGRPGVWPLEAMDFDHRPGVLKLGSPYDFLSEEGMAMAEAAKCDVICACCHRTRTKDRKLSEKAKKRSGDHQRKASVRRSKSEKMRVFWSSPENRERMAEVYRRREQRKTS